MLYYATQYKNLFRYYFFILFAYLHVMPSLLAPAAAPLGLTTIINSHPLLYLLPITIGSKLL